MKDLLKETIPGAEFDSSARDPPPRCLPRTRLGILDRCLYFIANCSGQNQMRWVVGGAGVGKSAIMQSVIESPKLQVPCYASIFFSVQGRDDGTEPITTLCFQLAAKSDPYRKVIENEVSRDPSLLQSSMQVQFQKFIVDPFIHPDLNSAGHILIIIDGLNECSNPRAPLELLRLISDFCIKYPSSPFVWLIASRPERHITSFFARANVKPLYEKEEMQVDSDESHADVEQFLRHELKRIKVSYSLDSHSVWPEEMDLRKLKNAAGGLFTYAHTVLKLIDNRPMTGIPRQETSTSLLNALYGKILSDIPDKVNIHTRKLILTIAPRWFKALAPDTWNFVVLCNWLAMSQDEAYAALNPLQAVFRAPSRDVAHNVNLEPFHKSFIDYISDSSQSHFFRDIRREAQQLKAQCASRILQKYHGIQGLKCLLLILLTWTSNVPCPNIMPGILKCSVYFPFSQSAPDDFVITVDYTRALQYSSMPLMRTNVYLVFPAEGGFDRHGLFNAAPPPTQLYPGIHLFGTTFYSYRDTYTSSNDSAFGIPHYDRHLVANVQALIPDPEASSTSNSDNTTATLRLTYPGGYPMQTEYKIEREQSSNSVLSGFALLGGAWTFINGLFATIFGCSSLLVLFGIKPLSTYGLVHLFQRRRSLVDCGYTLSAEEHSRTIAVLREHLLDDNSDMEANEASDEKKHDGEESIPSVVV
ncbi:hypothetical protein Agabi119p4_8270 [Agaricus bisporus var. burnettii]|uniref:Nephrocystin 3-like N-terminal domain-containing protein n=1 Tax=Agaricus bisporus var. burnettii TaxID=192524 RepID=A0A8H7C7M5_AGABI|nr:hypothetical protein Agabi119p4_8270 [Agaricus bisporus var. burnettii]